MSRYIAAPKRKADLYDDDDDRKLPTLPHPQVYVGEPVKTGLVDQEGNDIYRLPDQIGFLRK